MKRNRSWFLLLLLGLTAACTTSKTVPYQAKWNAPFNYTEGLQPDQQDQKSRLRYGIINDDQYLYLTLKTQDPRTVQQILQNGLRISFSPQGARQEAYSLLFPVVSREDRKAMQKIDVDLPNSISLNRMLDVFNKEALWKGPKGQRFINLITTDTGLRSHVSVNQNGELTEQLVIPFAMLGVNPEQMATLGVGIRVEGASGQSGLTPRVSVGMGTGGFGMGGFGMGGGGVGVGLGTGNRSGATDRDVNINLQVRLARSIAE
ncbi:hypothetical protein [Telluribacter sp. SYSU D00476]|uniref:hypothetical protein n=1 Tax=Telluribacter sp. SYSU D00476 TaxID=2811430 RepID=UPI001FF3C1C6|nr:hypothetical protein [Telluribacter sp. SYSU D00476]